ncbi:MAG: hypothetical protein M1365_06180 [Actinobacteria bacterium]|nr:hypothetical protein [Actinomycetota bacterium]
MTKAALISAGGDPFLAMFVIKLWQKYWYDEVDKIYVCFNTEMDKDNKFTGELLSRLSKDKKISIIYHPYAMGYGEPIRQMLLACREDLILLLEDDGFIYTPGIVEKYFKQIEDGEFDALGSPRFSCGFEIADAMKARYNLNFEGYGDKGPNYWPNFFFCKREDLLKTDLNFAPKSFIEGEYVKEIDHTMLTTEMADTFGWTIMQLRHMGIRFGEIPQHHASPSETEDYKNHTGNWMNSKPPYIHGGSLSSGWSWNGFLLGRQPIPDDINGLHEIETRAAFWDLISENIEGFDEFKKEYRQGVDNLINKLDSSLVRTKKNIYKEAMGM